VLGWVIALTALLALIETMTAKMRLLRVPHLVGSAGLLALGGVASWILGVTL
jgi:formate hydrogenlyase subunit 4